MAVVEPAERDLGRKLIRDCPAQEALQDFLQADGSVAGNTSGNHPNCRSSTGFLITKINDYITQHNLSTYNVSQIDSFDAVMILHTIN